MKVISVDKLTEILENIQENAADETENNGEDGTTRIVYPAAMTTQEMIDLVNDLPTVELPEPARWEPSPVMPGYVRCSGCHNCHVADDWLDGKKWKHCPECGAPMENGGQHG